MASFDTLVVDMQDVGLRYYTYYIALYYLMDAYQMAKSAGKTAEFWGKSWGNSRFWSDLLSGSSKLREQITAGGPAERIKAGWQSDIARFKKQRKPYLLYEETDKAIETL